MLPAEVSLGVLPPALAFVVVMAGLALRYLKQRGATKQDEWSRMADLLDELRKQRDAKDHQIEQKDALIEQQASYITDLRRDLREALKNIRHEEQS